MDVGSKFTSLGGVILQAPLASVYIFLDDKVKWDFYETEGDSFGSIYKIHFIRCPIMILHGKSDEIIRYKHSKLLYNKFINMNPNLKNNISLLLIENVNHNDITQLVINENSITCKKVLFFLNEKLLLIQKYLWIKKNLKLGPN